MKNTLELKSYMVTISEDENGSLNIEVTKDGDVIDSMVVENEETSEPNDEMPLDSKEPSSEEEVVSDEISEEPSEDEESESFEENLSFESFLKSKHYKEVK